MGVLHLFRRAWAYIALGFSRASGWPCRHGNDDPLQCDECWSERGL